MVEGQFRAGDGTGDLDEAALARYAEALVDATPLSRNGRPEDIASTIWFLASDLSAWMTGQILRPNGGTSMPW
jgi:NAD(P)-dependent dehydrogenase (short-subunit alcohol dehydrogenase family)